MSKTKRETVGLPFYIYQSVNYSPFSARYFSVSIG